MRPVVSRLSPLKFARLSATASAVALASSLIVPSSTETAVANGDTRTLNLFHSHTHESIQATFRVNGAYDHAVLEKLNYFLRDWRNNDQTRMDPRLFDVIWEVYRTAGATEPIVIVSAYRSPQTNAMLRRRSRGVAEHSQHILGRAMDTTMPGMPMEKIREIGMRLQRGGVGWYPSSNFVHLDVASVRAWPRMSYDQLVRLFPDGKTVHLAADGRHLQRYAEARAEIDSRGGVLSDVAQSTPVGGLFAWLFGKRVEVTAAAPAETAPQQASAPAHADHAVAQRGPEKDQTRVAELEPAPRLRGVSERTGSEREGSAAADIAQGKIDKRALNFAAVPLPPPRPAEPEHEVQLAFANVPTPPPRPLREARLVYADVPVPPARPASLAPVDSLGPNNARSPENKLASVAANNAIRDNADAPLVRAANLPVLITKGSEDRESAPKQVLAFAADAPLQNSLPNALNAPPGVPAAGKLAVPQTAAEPVRIARPKLRSLSGTAGAALPASSILGPSLTGLRRAARLIPGALSSKPSASDYASAFGTEPSDLDPDRFTGAAVEPLTLAQGVVRIKEDPPPVREN